MRKFTAPKMKKSSSDLFLYDGTWFTDGRFILHKDYFSKDLGEKAFIEEKEKKFVKVIDGIIEGRYSNLSSLVPSYDILKRQNYFHKMKVIPNCQEFIDNNFEGCKIFCENFVTLIPEVEQDFESCVKNDAITHLNFPIVVNGDKFKWFIKTGTSKGFSIYMENAFNPVLIVDETKKMVISAFMGLIADK